MNQFEKLEKLALLWRGLEAKKQDYLEYPEALNIINGAITRIRLEIILICQEITKEV